MVYFVGAGSGAPDLITVRGARLLNQADQIIYAGSLVNPELLDYKKESAVVYDSAKMTLEEVVEKIQEAESTGKMTVRLHTGDPCVYGAIRDHFFINIEGDTTFDSLTYNMTSPAWWGSYIRVKTGSTLTINNDLYAGNSGTNANFINFASNNMRCGASARSSASRRPCGGCSAARPSSSRRPSCGRRRRPSGSCRWRS